MQLKLSRLIRCKICVLPLYAFICNETEINEVLLCNVYARVIEEAVDSHSESDSSSDSAIR